MFKSVNPYTNQTLETYAIDSGETVQSKLAQAENAYNKWRKHDFKARAKLINNLGDGFESSMDQLAKMASLEMGKPIEQAKAEVKKCVWLCRHYAEHAEEYLQNHAIETDAKSSWVSYEPIGVILGVMPWNFPYWQAMRFAVPTLMAGNTVVVKHASNVQGSAREMEKIFETSGFEKGAYTNLGIKSDAVDDVIKNDAIKAVSLTGSEGAGASVAKTAAAAIKKSVLELGGSNAFVVLADANLDKIIDVAVKARMQNNGQSCIAAKRFIIEKPIFDDFIDRFKSKIEEMKVGDPMDTDTELGPVAREDLAEELEKQMKNSVKQGARILIGGKRERAMFEPTMLLDVKPGMPAFDEETFGPLAAFTVASSADEAIRLVNRSRFGLGATICSEELERAKTLGKEVSDGAVFINELVKSDPRLPFGGTKKSGYGRELGPIGIHEFVNAKTYFMA